MTYAWRGKQYVVICAGDYSSGKSQEQDGRCRRSLRPLESVGQAIPAFAAAGLLFRSIEFQLDVKSRIEY